MQSASCICGRLKYAPYGLQGFMRDYSVWAMCNLTRKQTGVKRSSPFYAACMKPAMERAFSHSQLTSFTACV